MTKIVKVYGDAGTGKTTWCINEMTHLINNLGINEDKIGYLTFSKTQANDAKKRIQEKTHIDIKRNKSIGTLHSVCTKLVAIEPNNYLKTKHKKEFCELFGIDCFYYKLEQKKEEVEQVEENQEHKGNALIQLYNHCLNFYATNPTELDDEQIIYVFEKTGIINKHDIYELPFRRFFREYSAFKQKHGLYDFGDIIFETYKNELVPKIDYLFIDEIQDLGFLMQQVLFNFIKSKKIKSIYLVGDEKQTIYRYLGANPKWFVDLKADKEIVFSQTYRCPKQVWNAAKKIQSKMTDIKEREVLDNGQEGEFKIIEFCDFDTVLQTLLKIQEMPEPQKVLVLSRTNKMWQSFSKFLSENKFIHNGLRLKTIFSDKLININNGIYKLTNNKKLDLVEVNYLMNTLPSNPFFLRGTKTKWKKQREKYNLEKEFDLPNLKEIGFIFGIRDYWKEKHYLINNLNLKGQSGELQKDWLKDNCNKILEEPNVFLGTIHSAKGIDADYVILFADSPALLDLSRGELDLWYVGITRAKKGVFVYCDLFDKSNSNNFLEALN